MEIPRGWGGYKVEISEGYGGANVNNFPGLSTNDTKRARQTYLNYFDLYFLCDTVQLLLVCFHGMLSHLLTVCTYLLTLRQYGTTVATYNGV